MTQPGNLINQKLSTGRLFIGAKLTAHKGTGQVLHREYQKSLMAFHLTCLTPSRDFRTELHLVIQDASLPVFLLICNLSRHPQKSHSHPQSLSAILFPFPFLSNDSAWDPDLQGSPHPLRHTAPVHIIALSRNHFSLLCWEIKSHIKKIK